MAIDFLNLSGPFVMAFRGEGAAAYIKQTPGEVLDYLMTDEVFGCNDTTREAVLEELETEDKWDRDDGDEPFECRLEIGEISWLSIFRVRTPEVHWEGCGNSVQPVPSPEGDDA